MTDTPLDLAALLEPVSEEQPAGPALRDTDDRTLSQLYVSLRDARKKAIEAERRVRDYTSLTVEERGSYGPAPEGPDWQLIERRAVEALHRSKDLWITAWLLEALTREHGFQGLCAGLKLAHGLCERFWDGLHPGADGDLVVRFAQFAGLDGGLAESNSSEGTLIAPIREIALTGGKAPPLSLADYRDALHLDTRTPEVRHRRVNEGAVTTDMFRKAVFDSGLPFLTTVLADIEAASAALSAFVGILGEKQREIVAAGGRPFAPPTSKLREAIGDCSTRLKAAMLEVFTPGATPDTSAGSVTVPDANPSLSATITTRHEAFATLLRVADYFRRTEPHSPVSYALEQAVRWGRMSLPELLSDLVADRSAREEIFRRAGIVPPPEKS